jgi:isopropylmalate/homocitrate/citramalate synthase
MDIDRRELDKEMLFDSQDRWYTARLNLAEVTRGTTKPPVRVIINDETLREGEETPGVYVSVADKVKVARALQAAGVPEIVVGFTGTVEEHFDIVHILREEGITAHLTSRAFAFGQGDSWKREVDRVKESGVDRIAFGGFLSECRIAATPWLTKAGYADHVRNFIGYAKGIGMTTAFGFGDPARNQMPFLVDCLAACRDAGLDRYYVFDAPGCATPETMEYLVRLALDLTGAEIAVHCHDDYGLATANTIRAVMAGAEVVDVVMNGLGDRCGNAALEEVVMALTVLYRVDTGIDPAALGPLSQLVADTYGVPVPPGKAIVGEYQYTHASDSHIAHRLKTGAWYTFENIRAEALGREEAILFGPAALGRTRDRGAIPVKIETMGVTCSDAELERIIDRVVAIVEERRAATEAEVEAIVRQEVGATV